MTYVAKSAIGKIVMTGGLLHCCLAIGQAVAPRASAGEYPASVVQPVYSIGAKQLSKTEIKNSFATPLAGRYVVVEVGFFPKDSKSINLDRYDFALRTSDGDVIRPASAETIASIYQKRPETSTDVTLYPTAEVGYVSGPSYDGSGRRTSGVVYGAGMGVGVDKTTSAATTNTDRHTMEAELLDKQLKDAEILKPVAGYLYFPVTTRQKAEYRLQYSGTDTVANLALKTPH
jgi:hypothetical protein